MAVSSCSSLPDVGIIGTPDQIVIIVPILKDEGFTIKAVWCKNSDISRQIADKHSITHCPSSFQDLLLLHDVDLVYVATEPVLQAEVAVKALTSGKHCISIKPPSVSSVEAEKMLCLSQYYSQLQSILESHVRFIPCFVELKQLIQNGSLGKLYAIDIQLSMDSLIGNEYYSWKCDPSLGGGVLNLVGSHFIDLIYYLCSSHIQQVHCLLNTFKTSTDRIDGYRSIESDDYCILQLKCKNGNGKGDDGDIIGTILINSHCPSVYRMEVTVTGSKGRALVHGLNLFWEKNGEGEKLIYKEDPISDKLLHEAAELNMPSQLYHATYIGYKGMFEDLKRMFLSPNGKESCLANFRDGHHLRTVLDQSHKSHKLSKWINIPLVTSTLNNSNPFWTSTSAGIKVESEKSSPRPNHPVIYI